MAGGPTRQDTHRIVVRIAHPVTGTMIDYGVFDKWAGGGYDSEETKYYPGSMADPVSLAGRTNVANVTISRLYRLERDHSVIQQMFDGVGKSKAVLSRQPLDINKNVFGRPIVYNATLKRVSPPDLDSEQSGPALLELEFT